MKPCFMIQTLLLLFIFIMPLQAQSALTADKTIAFLPLVFYADDSKQFLREGLRAMFVSRLTGTGLNVIGEDQTASVLEEKDKRGVSQNGRAEELARQLDADYVIFGSVTSIGAGYSLDLAILETAKGESGMTRLSEAVNEDELIPKLAEVANQFRNVIDGIDIHEKRLAQTRIAQPQTQRKGGLFFAPSQIGAHIEPTGRVAVKMDLMSFDRGDLDGDGTPELVLLGRNDIRVYVKQEDAYVLKGSFSASRGEDFMKVSVGDGDRDGKAEIYVNSRYGQAPRSRVFVWAGGFKRLFNKTGHVRIVKTGKTSKTQIIYQAAGMERFFSGKIWLMNYTKNGKLKKNEALGLPNGVQFYTLAFYDLNGDGHVEVLGLGEAGLAEDATLYVWNVDGEVLWKSDQKFGGTNNLLIGKAISTDEVGPRIPFNCHVAIADIDKDGKKEVVAVKNITKTKMLTNLKVFTKAKLVAFDIVGLSLIQPWESKELNYCITDIQADDDTLFLSTQKGRYSNIGKGSGAVLWFG